MLSTTARDLSSGVDWKEFSKRAREWAQYGLLTTPERRTRYRELAILMRQGSPAEEAFSQAFGLPIVEVSKEFDDGHWRREAVFKIPAPKTAPALPLAEAVDSAQASTLLQLLADRVAQQP